MSGVSTRPRKAKQTARRSGSGRRKTLPQLGVYGFDKYETVILAALVSGDPLLLIGRCGTGKTYLLNTLSEALGLEHRHYNASLIAFDDLVGFPYPEEDRSAVRFLETPATVWGAESVLIDEISRCKPEHQNRLFSLVHERRVQGIRLEKLRYRWAAMNPAGDDDGDGTNAAEVYTGSQSLDPALADRFALIVQASEWSSLRPTERKAIADPGGEGRVTEPDATLIRKLANWRERFDRQVGNCPVTLRDYAISAGSALNGSGIRLSPRRIRLLTRNLLAAVTVHGGVDADCLETVLRCSLPHVAWGAPVAPNTVIAAHRLAWDSVFLQGEEKWLHEFHLCKPLEEKVRLLVDGCPSTDTGNRAICELLANEPVDRAAAFAFALYPAVAQGLLQVGADAVQDLGARARPILDFDAEVSWRGREQQNVHPEFARYARALAPEGTPRCVRGRQFFKWCVINEVVVQDPVALEEEIERCVALVRAAFTEVAA